MTEANSGQSKHASRSRRPTGFTLVIPTFNRATLLARALASIQRLQPPEGCEVEVLVVDNNSSDATAEVCTASAGRYPVRRVVETKQGLNHGRNRALTEATHEFVVYLDDDMEIDEGWLTSCADGLARHAADAVCGPVLPRFESEPKAWLRGRLRDFVTSSYSLKGNASLLLESGLAHELPGCNFAVWREMALSIGGFHPNLDRSGSGMLAGGDTEFGHRLVAAGGRTLYQPGCGVLHLVSDSKVSLGGMARRWHGLGRTERALHQLAGRSLDCRQKWRRIRMVAILTVKGTAQLLLANRTASLEHLLGAWYQIGYLGFSSESAKLMPIPSKGREAPRYD